MNENDNSEWEKLEQDEDIEQSPVQAETKVKLFTKSKLGDFILGFLVFGAIDGLITWVFSIDDHYGFGKAGAFIIISIVNLVGLYYYSDRQRYFMFGMLILTIYPFLLLGSCFVR